MQVAKDLMQYEQLAQDALRAYPEEMTIVLEHQFWDLEVDDAGFEVTLKFGGVPKYLKVPWRAVTRFHDPSVGFRLHFDYATPSPDDSPRQGSDDDEVNEGTVVSLEAFRNKERAPLPSARTR